MKRIAAIAALLALLGGALPALAQFDYRTAGTYTTSVLQLRGSGTAPTLSPLGGGKIYFDTVCNCFKVSANGGAFEGLLLASTDAPVQSVFGRTGNVTALQADYDAFFTTTAEAAAAAPVQSVFGRTGAVVAAQADYDGFFLTEAEADALYHPLQASVVNSFNGRTGAVTPAQADYDGFFLTAAEGDAAYARLATANTFSGGDQTISRASAAAYVTLTARNTSATGFTRERVIVGDGTTSARYAYTAYESSETAAVSWWAGMSGSTAYRLFNAINNAVPFAASTEANPKVGLRANQSGAYGLYVPWLSGDGVIHTAYFGSANASNDRSAVTAESSSGRAVHGISASSYGVEGQSTSSVGVRGVSASSMGVQGVSTTGRAGYFQTIGASGFPVIELAPHSTHTGLLLRATTPSGGEAFGINKDGHVGIKGPALTQWPLVVYGDGITSNPIAVISTGSTTDRSMLRIQGGSGVTSSRYVVTQYLSNETATQHWETGMRASKAFAIHDQTNTRIVLSASETTGVVSFPQGISPEGVQSRGASGIYPNFFAWKSGDTGGTMYAGSANALNNKIALTAESYSQIGVHAISWTGTALQVETMGASGSPALDVAAAAAHTGLLMRLRHNNVAKFTVNTDGDGHFARRLGVGVTPDRPFYVSHGGHGVTTLATFQSQQSTDRTIVQLNAGNGTTSTRYVVHEYRTSESAPKAWETGMRGTHDWLLRDETRIALQASATTGVVDFPQGITSITGKFTNYFEVGQATAPSAPASGARLYVDSADGDLKVKFANGTVATLAVN